jgi:hypothetical protein
MNMFNFTHIARRALLAAALAFSSAAALAGPTYLVTIHTATIEAESGLMDFNYTSAADAVAGTVTLSNFSGAFGALQDRSGANEGELPGSVTFTAGMTSNYLTHYVIFGGDFSFNVSFGGDYETVEGPNATAFSVGLYDDMLATYFGTAVTFDLVPAFNGDPAGVLLTIDDAALATVSAVADVPEPSQLLLMLSALALAGLALRRRNG